VVIARRTSENERDLVRLLEAEAPQAERDRPLPPADPATPPRTGEPGAEEMLAAVAEWLETDVKPKSQGREKFLVAVAMNALGMVRRELAQPVRAEDRALAEDLLAGRADLSTPGLLARLRRTALDKLANDVPKYAALGEARALWGG
jgi:hypothetical protein